MKKIFAIVLLLTLAFVLVGCNVAPNVPGVSPYNVTNTHGANNPYTAPNVNTSKGVNTAPFGGVRQNVNPQDKNLLPGA